MTTGRHVTCMAMLLGGMSLHGCAERDVTTEDVLRGMGGPPGSGPLSDVVVRDQDGLNHEEASGTTSTISPEGVVMDHYRKACARMGLKTPASSRTLRYDPHALCDGDFVVSVTRTCDRSGCHVFLRATA